MPDPKKEISPLLIHNVPADLKAKFKAKCAEKKVSMEQTIINLMKKFIK